MQTKYTHPTDRAAAQDQETAEKLARAETMLRRSYPLATYEMSAHKLNAKIGSAAVEIIAGLNGGYVATATVNGKAALQSDTCPVRATEKASALAMMGDWF